MSINTKEHPPRYKNQEGREKSNRGHLEAVGERHGTQNKWCRTKAWGKGSHHETYWSDKAIQSWEMCVRNLPQKGTSSGKEKERWERQEATENLAAPNILDIKLDICMPACICACIPLSVCLCLCLCWERQSNKPGGKMRWHKQ